MRTAFPRPPSLRLLFARCLAGTLPLLLSFAAAAQQPASNSVALQRKAMHKLAFLVGRWSGPVTIIRRTGELHLTQSEDVRYRLGGLVLLIEGRSTSSDGSTEFSALATVSFDDATQTYHIRAYNDGHYVDAPLTVLPRGFSWGFPAGPARIVIAMHLTDKGRWQEVTRVTVGNGPSHPSVEMLLHHLS